jgi:hypothetical protein
VTWRGATVTGERPRSALPHLEAGWAEGIQRAGGAGPNPTGWTIELYPDLIRGCVDAPLCLGEFDPRIRRIRASWEGGIEETLAEEFCHYHRVRRGLPTEGGGCPT